MRCSYVAFLKKSKTKPNQPMIILKPQAQGLILKAPTITPKNDNTFQVIPTSSSKHGVIGQRERSS